MISLNPYVFIRMPARNEDETAMSELIAKYWANFAKYGHPNHLMEENLTLWKTFYPNNKVRWEITRLYIGTE